MDQNLASKCDGCLYRGRHVYVVGAQRFERELMANFIGTHTAAQWFQTESLKSVPPGNQGLPLGQKMILLDTHSLGREDILALFASKEWRAHSHNLMALFNVRHELQIEKEALRNGVKGFLYDDDSAEDLISGICAINSGEFWISRKILTECLKESYVGKELPEPSAHPLSNREVEILQVLVSGASNEAIADKLCISPHTVKTHLQNIFQKLDVTSRLQAVLWAKQNL